MEAVAYLVWLAPSVVMMAAELLPALLQEPLTPTQWEMLGTSLLIGFSEEVMFRGILLRGALGADYMAWAMGCCGAFQRCAWCDASVCTAGDADTGGGWPDGLAVGSAPQLASGEVFKPFLGENLVQV